MENGNRLADCFKTNWNSKCCLCYLKCCSENICESALNFHQIWDFRIICYCHICMNSHLLGFLKKCLLCTTKHDDKIPATCGNTGFETCTLYIVLWGNTGSEKCTLYIVFWGSKGIGTPVLWFFFNENEGPVVEIV